MFRLAGPLVLIFALVPTAGSAQAPDSAPSRNPRIRVAYSCMKGSQSNADCLQSGYLRNFDGDSLTLVVESGPGALTIPSSSVDRLWIADGKKGHFLEGAVIGLVAGAVLGAMIGSQLEMCVMTCGASTDLGLMAGAPAGLLIGGIIGATIRTDRWRQTTPDRLRLEIAPRLDQPGLVVSLEF